LRKKTRVFNAICDGCSRRYYSARKDALTGEPCEHCGGKLVVVAEMWPRPPAAKAGAWRFRWDEADLRAGRGGGVPPLG
jgi:hypothetical protein